MGYKKYMALFASCIDQCLMCSRRKPPIDRVFDAEPLLPPVRKTMHLPNMYTNELITLMLFQMLVHEFHTERRGIGETRCLGTENDDEQEFRCLLCGTTKPSCYIRYTINNAYFHNVWNANNYTIQYICLPCSKRLEPGLLDTVRQFHRYVELKQSNLLRRIVSNIRERPEGSDDKIHANILTFLHPQSFLSIQEIRFHCPSRHKRSDDLSVWVEEQRLATTFHSS